MPVLKSKPFVQFDPHNPEHVLSIIELETKKKRTLNFNFDFPAEFQNGVNYAKYMMARAWAEHMAVLHPELKHELQDQTTTMDPADYSGDNIRKLPVTIGSKSKPLQETPSRGLPPGSTLN